MTYRSDRPAPYVACQFRAFHILWEMGVDSGHVCQSNRLVVDRGGPTWRDRVRGDFPRFVSVLGLRSILVSDAYKEKKVRESARSSELVVYSHRWAVQHRPRRMYPVVSFITDGTGCTIMSYNRALQRRSTRKPAMERNAAWCKALTGFVTTEVEETTSALFDGDAPIGYESSEMPPDVVSETDCHEIRRQTRFRAFRLDTSRSRGYAENVWEDAAQDAIIRFALLLQQTSDLTPVAYSVRFRRPTAWQAPPRRRDSDMSDVFDDSDESTGSGADATERDETVRIWTRRTLWWMAVQDGCRRHNLASQANPTQEELTATIRPETAVRYVNTAYLVSSGTDPMEEHIWNMTWQDGQNRPILRKMLELGSSGSSMPKGEIVARTARFVFNQPNATGKWKATTMGAGADEWDVLQSDLAEARQMWRRVYVQAEND